jgi:hypothetical protein
VRLKAAEVRVIVLRNEEGDRPREHQAGQAALLNFSSSSSPFSERTVLIAVARSVTDFREGEVERFGGMAKLRRRPSGREWVSLEFKGRSDELITATSSASAVEMQVQRLNRFPSAIIT